MKLGILYGKKWGEYNGDAHSVLSLFEAFSQTWLVPYHQSGRKLIGMRWEDEDGVNVELADRHVRCFLPLSVVADVQGKIIQIRVTDR